MVSGRALIVDADTSEWEMCDAQSLRVSRMLVQYADSLQHVRHLGHRAKNERNVRLRFLLLGLPYEDLTKERVGVLNKHAGDPEPSSLESLPCLVLR